MRVFFYDIWQELLEYYDNLVVFMPKLLMASLVLLLAWLVARSIRAISDRKLKKQMEDPLLAEFLATLIRTFVFIIGISFAFKVLGLSGITSSILAGAGITAFVIGFALRDIGENFLAGILMAFKRPFRVGDFVETGAMKGIVVALNIRDTQLKTADGKDVFIPNANIIKNPFINYTIDGFLRYDINVSLPSGSNYTAMMEAMRQTIEKVEGVIKKRKKTTVNITGIAPGRIDLTVSFWIDTFTAKNTAEQIKSRVILRIQEVLEPPKVEAS